MSDTTTMFFNQVRHVHTCKKHGHHFSTWADYCEGHENFDTAVTCQELMKGALDGSVTESQIVDAASLELVNLVGHMTKQLGSTYEFRLVKRTAIITEEVLDA